MDDVEKLQQMNDVERMREVMDVISDNIRKQNDKDRMEMLAMLASMTCPPKIGPPAKLVFF